MADAPRKDGSAAEVGEPSLQLSFSLQPGYVEIRSPPALHDQLASLASRFVTSSRTGPVTHRFELDDLLLNIRELLAWPAEHRESVMWDPELLSLVESVSRDAAFVETVLTDGDIALAGVPDLGGEWVAPLTHFQMRDIRRILALSHGANFSVPGAGKTRVALAVFQARRRLGEVQRALVVAPKSAFEAWREENLLSFEHPLRMETFYGTAAPEVDILLVNYERLPDAREQLLEWVRRRPTLVVLDEAHRMKLGPAGAWGSTCFALAPYSRRRLILTGTPAPNGARDLENLFGFVWPGDGRSRVRRALQSNDLRQASIELRPLFARTTKNELGLPPVERVVRRVTLPPLHRELYQALLGQFSRRARSEDDFEALGRIVLYLLMAATSPALLSTGSSRHEPLAYRVPPIEIPAGSSLESLLHDLPSYEVSPKYAEVAAIVADNAERGLKTLVWSTFVRNLTTLEGLLRKYHPAVVHGGTDDRAEQIRRFREDPTCSVLLSNPATLGEGISLHQVCHDAVYVDRDFAAGRFLQSLDRIHRLGLAPSVVTRVTVLVTAETIDEVVEERLARKLTFMGRVLDDPAVLELADLDEEVTATAGMDVSDVAKLREHLRVHPAA